MCACSSSPHWMVAATRTSSSRVSVVTLRWAIDAEADAEEKNKYVVYERAPNYCFALDDAVAGGYSARELW